MQKNPYIVLGVNENATMEELYNAYNNLKIKYSMERFLEGEEGRAATVKLAEIEQSYSDALTQLKLNNTVISTGSIYGEISDHIKAANYSLAQDDLDKVEFRDAEWHYYQSIIYYKKQWMAESKKQLEICVALEPTQDKYNKALQRINEAMAKESPFDNQGNPQQPNMDHTRNERAGYGQPNANRRGASNACCDGCCMMMCCDSCCECFGGDCISCC